MKKTWDIFCTVVDNYGDMGVCLRLARQLAVEHGLPVRLWVDDLTPLLQLVPGTGTTDIQLVQGVEVRHWTDDFPQVETADVVIEAFACELPDNYLKAMAVRADKLVWINLEYLSAESWVEDCHLMVSPHPQLPITKHFFFPGFTARTGGLLRERDYEQRRNDLDREAFCRLLDIPLPEPEELTVSLFAYENPGVGELLQAWSQGERTTRCLVPEGRLLPSIRAWAGEADSRCFRRGALTIQVLPFLAQTDYDRLLWLCDLNFVRGEDSFVRAQWAAKPFVWHIYPQEGDHHRAKLAAFLDQYLEGLPDENTIPIRAFALAWEQGEGVAAAWPAFERQRSVLLHHGEKWAAGLSQNGDLVSQLLTFVMKSS